jgi:hypothetical protein
MVELKKILNLHEEITHKRLREVCSSHGVSVYPKLRLAEVFPIENSGLPNDLYRYALQSHFDFIIADESQMPIFAVEFDGPRHKSQQQKTRDKKKDTLCEHFEFPLLRINARHLGKKYRNFDLLTWFVELWFLRKAFFEAQDAGSIPPDEIFDPAFFYSLPGRSERFPMWLSVDLRAKIKRLAEEDRCLHWIPSEYIGVDDNGNYHGLAWLRINENSVVVAETAMRSQQFPVIESEILSEILIFQLHDELELVLQEKSDALPLRVVDKLVKKYEKKYELRSYRGVARDHSASSN